MRPLLLALLVCTALHLSLAIEYKDDDDDVTTHAKGLRVSTKRPDDDDDNDVTTHAKGLRTTRPDDNDDDVTTHAKGLRTTRPDDDDDLKKTTKKPKVADDLDILVTKKKSNRKTKKTTKKPKIDDDLDILVTKKKSNRKSKKTTKEPKIALPIIIEPDAYKSQKRSLILKPTAVPRATSEYPILNGTVDIDNLSPEFIKKFNLDDQEVKSLAVAVKGRSSDELLHIKGLICKNPTPCFKNIVIKRMTNCLARTFRDPRIRRASPRNHLRRYILNKNVRGWFFYLQHCFGIRLCPKNTIRIVHCYLKFVPTCQPDDDTTTTAKYDDY